MPIQNKQNFKQLIFFIKYNMLKKNPDSFVKRTKQLSPYKW